MVLHPKIPTCSGLDSHNEQTTTLKVPLQTELRFRSRGYKQTPHRKPAGRQTPGDSPATSTAVAMVPGRTRPLEGSRSRPHSRDANQILKPKSRRLVRGGADGLVGGKAYLSTCPPTPHRRASAAPKRTGRSSLPSSPRKRGQRMECCILTGRQ
jgi:hypothetical protein